MTGTLLNVVTVLLGATIGARLGGRLPDHVRETVMNGLGLMTLLIGLQMALTTRNLLIVLTAILLGSILGEVIDLQGHLDGLGRRMEERFAEGGEKGNFTRGFVTASLVFCVGPLSILGPIQDGLLGDFKLLAIKSTLDAFTGLAFASTLGIGVAFSALTVLVYQGAISGVAMLLGSALGAVTRDTPWVIEMSATGGVLIMGLALVLLNLKPVRVANLLPAVFLAPAMVLVLAALGIGIP